MARKKQEPISMLVRGYIVAAFITGAFAAMLLTIFIPMPRPYDRWVQLGGGILCGVLSYQWLKRTSELPAGFFGIVWWAMLGNVVFFTSQLAQTILEIWFDLTPYQVTIDLVSFACPVFFGAIGALKHKDDVIEEENNNG